MPATQKIFGPLARAGLVEFECLSLATFMGFDAIFEGSLEDRPMPLADPTTTRTRGTA